MLVDFCLPIKDEEDLAVKNVTKLINYLTSLNPDYDWQVTVIINGSSDNSYINLKDKIESDKFRVISITEAGKSRAIKKAWSNSEADILTFMDIDLAVPLNFIEDLVNPIKNKNANLVIASRFLKDSQVSRSWQRWFVSRFYILLSKLILNHRQTDLQCGFKAIDKNSFREIERYLKDNNWFLDTELIVFSKLKGLKIKEIAVNWSENRKRGQKSGVKIFKDGFNFISNLIKLKLRITKLNK